MMIRFTMFDTDLIEPGDLTVEAEAIVSIVETAHKDTGVQVARLLLGNGAMYFVRDPERTIADRIAIAREGFLSEEMSR